MGADDRDESRETREIEAAWLAGRALEKADAEQKREVAGALADFLKIVGGAALWLLGLGLLIVGLFLLLVFAK